jgi:hypothetical protein
MNQLERIRLGQTTLADKAQIGFLAVLGTGFVAVAGGTFTFGLSQFSELVAGLPWPFVVLAGVALLFTVVRCIESGRYFPLVLVQLWVAGIGLCLAMGSAGPDADSGLHEMVYGRLALALPWVFVGMSVLSAALTLGV